MIFTSEAVSSGHPDKVADQISDALLDEALRRGDQTTRCAIETMVTTNFVVVAGEVKNFNLTEEDVHDIIIEKIKTIGYEQTGFNWRTVEVVNKIHNQSTDIALGTDDFGAGDQGLMFGYATNKTESMLPEPIHYATEIIKKLERVTDLGPDAKAQVSLRYEDGVPVEATSVVVSIQHPEGDIEHARTVGKHAAKIALGDLVTKNTNFFLNSTGNFVIGGPDGDAGLTGRKIIVDTYGGWAPHGGGAFSGKDPSKVDRSGAYMARFLAKWLVSHNLCEEATIQLSYAIGVKEPTSILVRTENGEDTVLSEVIRRNFDLTPKGIIDFLGLFDFHQYSKNCVHGHFGIKNVPWEDLDRAKQIIQKQETASV